MLCLHQGCDKSFARPDSLHKHLRNQHNISPPPPARGGSRKRKRAAEDDAGPSAPPPPVPSPAPTNNAGTFNTFKVESHTLSEVVFEDPQSGAGATQHEFRQDDFTLHPLSHPPRQRSENQNQSHAPTNGVHRSASPAGLPPKEDEDEG